MKLIISAVSLIAITAAMATAAQASPAFCTGSTTVVGSGDFVLGSFLVNIGPGTSTGNCVQAADKVFGDFSVGGAISGNGSAGWLFNSGVGPTDVTIGFQGLVGENSTGFVNYSVAVDPLTSNGALITALEKDFTLNCVGIGCTATLTGIVTPGAVSFTGGDITTGFQCTRTVATSTCPQTGTFDPLIDLLEVDQTITTGPNTRVTAITDTVFQAVPEPASTLGLLGIALIGLWFAARGRPRHFA